jgi:DNA polymerase-4
VSPVVTPRRILHLDMDAFYASVEQRDDPSLRGRPVAVGGDPKGRGVVAAASYEARKFGVRSAIPMARAVRLCPHLAIVRPDFKRYSAVSKQILDLYRAVTPLVEPLSLDEAYLDVTENAWNEPLGVNVARRLKRDVHDATSLTVSAGVAPNKFLAKIASGWKKPDGLTVIAPVRVERFLEKLPVDALWGVGPKTAEKLLALGCVRLVDVRRISADALRRAVGSWADSLARLARGEDDRPVVPDRRAKSCSTEDTFAEDLADPAAMRATVESMARHDAAWLNRRELFARTVVLKVRYGDFTTVSRSDTRRPTRDADELADRAASLLGRTEAATRPVRLLGVGVHGLMTPEEMARATPPDPQLPLLAED